MLIHEHSNSKVCVELLSYGASNCKADALVQQLSRGGELISFVWLLMVQLGLGNQFRIEEGHARAKLIVGQTEPSKFACLSSSIIVFQQSIYNLIPFSSFR